MGQPDDFTKQCLRRSQNILLYIQCHKLYSLGSTLIVMYWVNSCFILYTEVPGGTSPENVYAQAASCNK